MASFHMMQLNKSMPQAHRVRGSMLGSARFGELYSLVEYLMMLSVAGIRRERSSSHGWLSWVLDFRLVAQFPAFSFLLHWERSNAASVGSRRWPVISLLSPSGCFSNDEVPLASLWC